MRPMIVSVGPLAAAADNNIATSQTPSAGALTLNGVLASGGVATLDAARRVLVTLAGNETGKTITITGTNWSGSTISEALAGTTAGTLTSVLDYKTVTGVSISSAAAGAMKVGTTTIASSPWVRFDDFGPSNISIQATVSGTVNYSIQSTLDDPNNISGSITPATMTWVDSSDTAVVSATATKQSNFLFAPTFARVLLNSGSGSVTASFLQSGVTPQ